MANVLISQGCSTEMAMLFSALTLYDVALLTGIDSMEFEEGGARKTILEFVVRAICEIYTLARPGGINRTTMLNNKLNASNVTYRRVDKLLSFIVYSGLSVIGTNLREKILVPFLDGIERRKTPLLAIIITDGDTEGERKNTLRNVIEECLSRLQQRNQDG
ncbi:hypothetical protein FPQ18DRAFT_291419 [Pyronema domesticum]|nr:hypothetical protein FPQ18DRAFT_291419 [Pyronema domesticum]